MRKRRKKDKDWCKKTKYERGRERMKQETKYTGKGYELLKEEEENKGT